MRKLGRKKAHRNHVLRNLLTSLVLYERITTTESKAKDVKLLFDKIISRAKKQNELTGRRMLDAVLFEKNAVKKIYEVLLKRFEKRNSGFTKIYKLGPRVGDGAQKVIIEITDQKKEGPKTAPSEETENKIKLKEKTVAKVKKDKVSK